MAVVGESALQVAPRKLNVLGLMGMYPSESAAAQEIGGEAMGTYESSWW